MKLKWIQLFCLAGILYLQQVEGTAPKVGFEKFRNKFFIETGSYEGEGIAMAIQAGFPSIYSIELAPFWYHHCKDRFGSVPSVHLFFGDSTKVLEKVLCEVDAPATFWLDGHWSGEGTAQGKTKTPILAELAAIAQHPIKNHTILIDDIRCCGTSDFDFIDLEEIIEKILEINGKYKITFEHGTFPRDILVAQVEEDETSLSAVYNGYRGICSAAVVNESIFQRFKKNKLYQQILEHLTESQGKEYFDFIKTNYSHLLERWEKFRENDLIGSPDVYIYPQIGETAPTTLRYAKVLGDLERYFGSLHQKKIIEIGGGYGGQCLVISKLYAFQEYQIVDLAEPKMLTEKYLLRSQVPNSRCLTCEDIAIDEQYDLVISNYAFSEFDRAIQERYLEKVLKNAKHGYLTLNGLEMAHETGTFTLDELTDALRSYGFNPAIFEEQPLTARGNRLLIW